ncbi:hypothetical protein [Vibrio kanaloae]|uniref:Uncharacterized protein n=1 Tax=Vibrio kanaloae TaxID=170673 RepID=A0A4U1YY45_9VIBR|nr:hypothetical protein [Vibrio kanaloae]TKF26585.1 hypothetical protein FCV52_08025 [Vibrio kanaloae]
MNINHIREVIFSLTKEREMELFDLNDKFRLTPSEAGEVVEDLLAMGVLKLSDRKFSLKDKLSEEQMIALYKITRKSNFDLESEIIDKYKEKSEIFLQNKLYLPNFERLDSSLLVDSSSK